MENISRFFRRIGFSYKMASVLSDWRAFFTIDLLIPLMQMMCYSLVGYYVYGAENIEKSFLEKIIFKFRIDKKFYENLNLYPFITVLNIY